MGKAIIMGSDISKSMTGCRMRVTITVVTAKHAKQMSNPQGHSIESIQELTQKMT